jgi:hypothetical protein
MESDSEDYERMEREAQEFTEQYKSKAEKIASDFMKVRRLSLEEKEKETINKLSEVIKEDPEYPKILDEIQNYRKSLLGIGQPSKKQESIPKKYNSSVKTIPPKPIRLIIPISYSEDAQKVYHILTPVLKKFMSEYPFKDSVKLALYKYFILFLLNDPNQSIQEIGNLFDEKLKIDIHNFLTQIDTQIIKLEKQAQDIRTFSPGSFFTDREKKEVQEKNKEIRNLKSLFSMFILSDIQTIKKYIIKEIGKQNLEEFVDLIASYFYEPVIGTGYLKAKSRWDVLLGK